MRPIIEYGTRVEAVKRVKHILLRGTPGQERLYLYTCEHRRNGTQI